MNSVAVVTSEVLIDNDWWSINVENVFVDKDAANKYLSQQYEPDYDDYTGKLWRYKKDLLSGQTMYFYIQEFDITYEGDKSDA